MESLNEPASSDKRPFDETPLHDPGERKIIFAVLDSFRQYRRRCHYNTTHLRRQNLYALPKHTWSVLASPPINLLDTLGAVDDAIDLNADLADAILKFGLQIFGLSEHRNENAQSTWHNTAKPSDMSKVHSTIRQFYRDWSEEGFKAEIEPLLEIVLSDLQGLPASSTEASPRILLPGAGLGRLLFELCCRGFTVEGNEISYHQLLASHFILNGTQQEAQYKIYPFATTFTNHTSRHNQLRSYFIPAVHPGRELHQQRHGRAECGLPVGEMNMTAGDFLTSYSDEASRSAFDSVLTVYFIDTAPNLVRYIETVRRCLKDDGIWINIGPLLWHFDGRKHDIETDADDDLVSTSAQNAENTGIAEPGSFELTDEEVLVLISSMGFEIVAHENLGEHAGGYIQDRGSMLQSRYRCSHWVAQKKAAGSPGVSTIGLNAQKPLMP